MITWKEFRNWQASVERHGRPIMGIELAFELGMTPETLSRYRRQGVPDEAERRMRLAMAAISAGLKPWGEK